MNERIPESLFLELYGPAGSGKSALLATWYYLLTFGSAGRSWLACHQPTPEIEKQAALLAEGKFFEPTRPTNGLPLDDPTAPKERLRLQRLAPAGRVAFELECVSEAGEEIQVALRS